MYEAELAIIRNYADSLPVPSMEMKEAEFPRRSAARWAVNEIETRILGEGQFVDAFYPDITDDYVPQTPYEIVCWYIFDLEYMMGIRKVPSVNLTFEVAHETACEVLHLLNDHMRDTRK